MEPIMTDEARDPLADLLARGAVQKRALVEDAGGVLSVDEVAARLGISRAAVEQRRRTGQLLAVPSDAGPGYPACQFEGGTVVPGLAEVLALFGLARPWGALAFLLTPNDDQLGGLTPLDALKKRDPALIAMTIRLARAHDSDGFG